MNISLSHLTFWRLKKLPGPSWFCSKKAKVSQVTIDDCVNDHAGMAYRKTVDPHFVARNTLAILKSARSRGQLIESLKSMASDPECVIKPNRRRAYCMKWLSKIGSRANSTPKSHAGFCDWPCKRVSLD